jgi:hypothetical protein
VEPWCANGLLRMLPARMARRAGSRKLVERGWSRARIGREYSLSPTQVSTIVAEHPRVVAALKRAGRRLAVVARRFRIELSTAQRIVSGRPVERTRMGEWTPP